MAVTGRDLPLPRPPEGSLSKPARPPQVSLTHLCEVLASRCIAISMRRTDKQMPSFPPDFDGASLRHQLYTLALTHFQAVYRNYFERPELHNLHNRSGELWSPLVALATFFEEQGSIAELRTGVTDAASWDEQLSEGKALSDREEAVLQALELMTPITEEATWLKATQLREQVRQLLGYSTEQMGHAQWIGHILNRLHLIDARRRQRDMHGQRYLLNRNEILEMMRRYDVAKIEN